MTEQLELDKYVKCSKCKCKYINDDENIEKDFGYNRLKIKYKTCVKCRNKSAVFYNDNAGWVSDYNRVRYHIPCEFCKYTISKYQMARHKEICPSRDTQTP